MLPEACYNEDATVLNTAAAVAITSDKDLDNWKPFHTGCRSHPQGKAASVACQPQKVCLQTCGPHGHSRAILGLQPSYDVKAGSVRQLASTKLRR